jgi:hypothetical protein
MEVDGEVVCGQPILVYGATRLAAAIALGWEWIDTQIVEGSDLDFQKAEIIENLHRADLTVLQRAEWTAELFRLCLEEAAAAPGSAGDRTLFSADVLGHGVQGPRSRTDRGRATVHQVSAAIKRPGENNEASRVRVRRALPIAAILPEAKAARELGKPRSTIQRDLKIATITPPAEAAAIEARLGDTPSRRSIEPALAPREPRTK